MGIGVQCQSNCGMSQSFLHSFWMDVLRCKNGGIGMSKIVETYFWQPQFYQSLFEMPVNVPVGKRRSIACCKNEPTFLPILQCIENKSRHGHRTPGLLAFWFAKPTFIVYLLQSSLDTKCGVLEIDIVPMQS